MDIPSYVLGKKAGGGGSNFQSKSVEITENGTTNIRPDTGYDALSNVNVTVNGILDTSDADAVASDMAMGKTAYVNGNKVTGDVPVGSSSVSTNYSATNLDIYLDDLQVDTEQGNRNQMFRTGDKISVYAPLSDVAQAVGASAGKIKKDEVICGVTGTYEGGGDDWSDIGYSSTPEAIDDIHNYSKQIYDEWDADNPHKINSDNNLIILPLIDTSKITGSMYQYFQRNNNLKEVPALTITNNVTGLNGLFYYCFNLEKVDCSNWDTSSLTSFQSVFKNCSSLKNLDLSNLDLRNTSGLAYYETFSGCSNLTTINFGNNFDTSNITSMNSMFSNCTKLDDNTLNQILRLCINTTSVYTGAKTLAQLGITSSFDNFDNIPNLSNYQAFLDAGWTIS